MQIIRDIEQGSEAWLQLRLGVATASNFDKIITAGGKESATLPKYALELATQCLLTAPEPCSISLIICISHLFSFIFHNLVF